MSKDFSYFENIIIAGKKINLKNIPFDINKIHVKEEEVTTHETDKAESKTVTSKQYTLVHCAIEAKNEAALIELLDNGADPSICHSITSTDMHIDYPEWSTSARWEEIRSETITKTSEELAKGSKKIIKILQEHQKQNFPDLLSDDVKKKLNVKKDKDKDKDKPSEIIPDKKTKQGKTKLSPKISVDEKKKNTSPEPKIKILKKAKKIPVIKQTSQKDGRSISMYSFPDKKQAQEKEVKWQQNVVAKFLRVKKPLKPGKKSHEIHSQLLKQIEAEDSKDKKPIKLDGICKRSFIIALAKILSIKGHVPTLIFSLGITIIGLNTSDKNGCKRQRGNCEMKIMDREYDLAYGSGAIKKLNMMFNRKHSDGLETHRKKQLLHKLGSTNFDSLNTEDFNHDGQIKVMDWEASINQYTPKKQQNFVKDHVHFLNGLLFLMTVVEVIVRLYRDHEGEVYPYTDQKAVKSDKLPVAIAQARSLCLLLNQKITFKDFIGESDQYGIEGSQHRAIYGLVTGQNTIDNLDIINHKLQAINGEYNLMLGDRDTWKDLKKRHVKDHPQGYLLAGKSRMFFDLSDCYGSGSESDSDESDYSSDDSELEINKFQP